MQQLIIDLKPAIVILGIIMIIGIVGNMDYQDQQHIKTERHQK